MAVAETAFDLFRSRRTAESLLELLGIVQVRIYNICLQVLRHPQESEEATRQVLEKLLEEIDRLPDGKQFQRWIYRAALGVALETRRERMRQSKHDSGKVPLPDSTPDARAEALAASIHDALASLSDEQRVPLIRHYFEKGSMEELSRDEGATPAAVWGRISKAKERLKEAVHRLGLAAIAPTLDPFLESIVPATPLGNLITDSLAARAGQCAARIAAAHDAPRASAPTGRRPIGVLVSAAILLAAAGALLGAWIHSRISPSAPDPAPDTDRPRLESELEQARKEILHWRNEARRAGTRPQDPGPSDSAQAEIAELKQKVQDLERRLSGAASPTAPGDPREIYAQVRTAFNGLTLKNLKSLGRLNDLTPDMSSFFAEKLRESRDKDEQECSLLLLLYSKGPETVRVIRELLEGNSFTGEDRHHLIRKTADFISDDDDLRRIPLDLETVDLALRLTASNQLDQRLGAVAVLGTQSTDAARIALRKCLEMDPDTEVQEASARSLGSAGDQATLDYLRGLLPQIREDSMVAEAIRRAIIALKSRLGK